MKVAIVGAEESKWNSKDKDYSGMTQLAYARWSVGSLLYDMKLKENLAWSDMTVVSGHCPRGGVDIWAEEVADELEIKKEIYSAPANQWDDKIEITHHNFDNASLTEVRQTLKGFKSRNIQIAEASDVLYCLSPKANSVCIHCKTTGHLKNGGCWTLRYAEKLGKKVVRLVI